MERAWRGLRRRLVRDTTRTEFKEWHRGRQRSAFALLDRARTARRQRALGIFRSLQFSFLEDLIRLKNERKEKFKEREKQSFERCVQDDEKMRELIDYTDDIMLDDLGIDTRVFDDILDNQPVEVVQHTMTVQEVVYHQEEVDESHEEEEVSEYDRTKRTYSKEENIAIITAFNQAGFRRDRTSNDLIYGADGKPIKEDKRYDKIHLYFKENFTQFKREPNGIKQQIYKLKKDVVARKPYTQELPRMLDVD
jgi:hypothetical protein